MPCSFHLFPSLALAAIILLGCGTAVAPEPRVVKMYDVDPKNYPIGELNGCDWEQVNLQLFNSKAQRIKFRYLACPKYSKKFKVKGGDTIVEKIQHREIVHFNSSRTVLKVEKLGPSTPENFMKSQIPLIGKMSKKCKVFMSRPGVWKKESSHDWVRVTPIGGGRDRATSDPCGAGAAYPDYAMEGDDYIFKDGIVFTKMSGLGGIDISSIVYENKG